LFKLENRIDLNLNLLFKFKPAAKYFKHIFYFLGSPIQFFARELFLAQPSAWFLFFSFSSAGPAGLSPGAAYPTQ
jgi:hypothetical protein